MLTILSQRFGRFSLLLIPLAVLVASGCSGGNSIAPTQAGSPAQLSPSKNTARGSQQIAVTFTIPARIDAGETSPNYRGLKFLSPAAQGIEVAERCTGGSAPNCVGSGVGNAQTAVPSSGANQQILYYLASSVCNNATPRVCTMSFPSYPVAAGQGAQFEVDVLDTPPASNATTTGPATANLLGAGLGQPNQTPSGATSVAITTLQGIFGRLIFPTTSLTGTVGNGVFPKFGDFSNARLQRDFGPGPIFVASASGAGNASGSPVSGFGANVGQDTSGNLIGTVSSGCVVGGPDQYGNSLTPSGSNDPSDVLNGSVTGSVYAQLKPTSGQSTHHYAVEVLAGEAYAGAGPPLMSAQVQPCGQSSSSFSASGPNNGDIGIAGADFPGDFFSWQYNPTNKAPTASNAVSQNGGQTGDATNIFAFGPSAPYFGVFAAGTQPYSDASMQYGVPAQFLYWIDQPFYGEAYIPTGSNGTVGCQNFGQTSSGAPAEAFNAGPTGSPAGSLSGGACLPGLIVNLFGVGSPTGTTAYVYALQNWKPTGGTYSATPNSNCAGVVSVSAATGNLFQKAGVLATDGTTIVPYGAGAISGNGGGAFWKLSAGSTLNSNTAGMGSACMITFSDSYNSFNVTVTNAVNPQQYLYVANNGNNTVTVFAANPSGNVTGNPLATIGGGSTGVNNPRGVAFDASGKIYVVNNGNSTVTVYAANPSGNVTGAPLATIGGGSTGLSAPRGVALDASGKIYVANLGNDTVTVYAANPSGAVTGNPLATIGGGSTGINGSAGVTLDANGQIYVANFGNSTVTVYAANPSGNVTGSPLATIGGGSAGVSGPAAIALDASGKIYVANLGNNTVTVYAANPSGNVTGAPLATIGGGSTGVNGPRGVALDASGKIYVANSTADTVTVYAANPSGAVTGNPLATYGGGSTGISQPFGVAVH